jgi:hypothetical protein
MSVVGCGPLKTAERKETRVLVETNEEKYKICEFSV